MRFNHLIHLHFHPQKTSITKKVPLATDKDIPHNMSKKVGVHWNLQGADSLSSFSFLGHDPFDGL